MLSKQSMFDQIQALRNETNKHFDRISSSYCHHLWWIYQKCKTKAEFKEKAKKWLGW